MDLKPLALCSTLLLLSACNHQPWVPYVAPPAGTDTAKLRVITNGEVRGGAYTGCVGNEQGLAKAGRFYDVVKPSINYPQSPLVPPKLGMPPRVLPKMAEYLGVTSMAEGMYTEIVAEYQVPAGKPFLMVREELAVGSYGSTYSKCPALSRVYTFEKGRQYEAYVGMVYGSDTEGKMGVRCPFFVYELLAPNQGIPMAMESTVAADRPCR
ncbi:amidase [Pseudomonas sp. S5D5]|uniref:amidase n=1 Tax=Pseudomonas sp. S5D5 TaxID=2083056 RepID=UPI000D0FDFC8|nr:amidase [Pseudomonas sp. S5D5]AYF46188.1 amidase [Pseudomonas fluorescens]QTV19707.1 amidase [Pseudomonas fluorescens]